MKTKFIYGVAALALASCQNNQFTITMEMPSIPDSTLVTISGYESNATTDTVLVLNGKATFSGTIEGTEIRRITVTATRLCSNVILEPGDITVNMESNSFCGQGTPLNDKLQEYNKWETDLFEAINADYDKIMSDSTLSQDEKSQKADDYIADFEVKIAAHADSLIALNKNNSLGRFIFWTTYNQEITHMEYDKYKAALDNAGEYVASYEPIAKGTKMKENLNKTKVGSKFIDFTIENGTVDGNAAKLSDYVGNGKVILVDFWASWCGPCRRAMPFIKTLYEKFSRDEFDVLGVAVWDKRERTLQAIEEEKLTWNLIIDAESIPTDIYGIEGIPELILFDKDGTILLRTHKPSDIEDQLNKALGK